MTAQNWRSGVAMGLQIGFAHIQLLDKMWYLKRVISVVLLIGQWHHQSWNPASIVGQPSLEQGLLASCELNLNLGRRFAGQEYCWCFQSGQWDHWRHLLSRWLPIPNLALWGGGWWWWIMGGNQDKDPWLEIRIREAQLHQKGESGGHRVFWGLVWS